MTLNRKKIGVSYWKNGYGRGLNRKAIIYLIEGKLYAADKQGASSQFEPLTGDLENYVRVNEYTICGSINYFQCSKNEHREYKEDKNSTTPKAFENLSNLELSEAICLYSEIIKSFHTYSHVPVSVTEGLDKDFAGVSNTLEALQKEKDRREDELEDEGF